MNLYVIIVTRYFAFFSFCLQSKNEFFTQNSIYIRYWIIYWLKLEQKTSIFSFIDFHFCNDVILPVYFFSISLPALNNQTGIHILSQLAQIVDFLTKILCQCVSMCHIANYSNCIILMAFNLDTKSIFQKVKEGNISEFNQCSLLYAFFTKLHSNEHEKKTIQAYMT